MTGIALNATIDTVLEPVGIGFGLFTIVVGHATFCIVVVYNNVGCAPPADRRLVRGGVVGPRRRYLADVPARHVPALGTAILAGGLLAFGLSFDEVVVTIFTAGGEQTLPIWIFANLARPISCRSSTWSRCS